VNDFSGVQSAEQKRLAKRSEAEAKARDVLNTTAGEAHAALVTQIDAYEGAIAKGDKDEQGRVFDSIRSLLDQKAITIGGQTVNPSVSGNVAQLLGDAREYSSSIVSRRRAELAAFQSKLAQYRTNPGLVVHREWADAMRETLARDNVEIQMMPPGLKWYRLLINADPKRQRDLVRAQKLEEGKKADEKRNRELEQNRYKTSTEAPMKAN
jgi:hypothetical protein